MSQQRFAMAVDLNRCVGCQTCTIACKHANDTVPGVQWRRVLDLELGTFPDVERLFLVVGCQHCAEPPCVPVCPTGATFQRPDGLVAMDYDACIGCGYCAVACPYQARTIAHEQQWYFGTETKQENRAAHPERIGVAQKCTFCIERIDDAAASSLTPGVDFSVTPACASSCIAEAIHFGDAHDPNSALATLLAENQTAQMHPQLGTDPQIHYLYSAPAVPGRDAVGDDVDAAHLEDIDNPLTGTPQTLWDLRAAANFTLGGFGAGLSVMAWLCWAAGTVPTLALKNVYALGALLMAIGLLAVFFEIGRKSRFLYVLRRPQTSWMTRETYAVAVYYPALLAMWLWPSAFTASLVAAAGAAFLYCQGRILHASKGIPAWRVDTIPSMVVAAGLLEGTALLALLDTSALLSPSAAGLIALTGAALALLNILLWHGYLRGATSNGIGPLAQRVLRITGNYVIAGQVGAFILFLQALTMRAEGFWFGPAASVLALAAGALWKITLIIRAGHQQGFALPKLPQRGSGTRAAPTRTV